MNLAFYFLLVSFSFVLFDLCWISIFCSFALIYIIQLGFISIIKGSLDEKLPSYEVLKVLRE